MLTAHTDTGGGHPISVARMFGGVLFFFASSFFAVFFVRCPRCRSRWIWSYINSKQHGFGWFLRLYSESSYVTCGWPAKEPPTPDENSQSD
jgi:hypothetical protein